MCFNIKNYKGEILENKDKAAEFIGEAGTRRYYIYNDDIYFEDLVEN